MIRKILKSSVFSIVSSLFILFSSFAFAFVGGMFSKETIIDEVANYTSDIVKTKTESGTYLGTIVEPSDENARLPDSIVEFNGLYGVFRQEKATFGSLFNADKKVNISFLESKSSDLSIFCLGPNGTIPYKDHFKHYVYPFEMLFEDEPNYSISKYIAYLSISQAEDFLANRGVAKTNDEYTLAQFKELLGTKTELLFNGIAYEYVIGNIFIESNYYYECFKETCGDFFLTSYFAPEEVSKQHMYFLTSFIFQNKFFMNYLNRTYNSSFKISFSNLNFKEDIDSSRILTFRSANNANNSVFIISCILSALLAITGYYLFFRIKTQKKVIIYISHILFLFFPYLIFKSLFLISHNINLFSTVSSIGNAILVISGLAFYSLIFIRKNLVKSTKPKLLGEQYCEIGI